jgi:pimeloyl-ACP methyl ester carboxylesterase
VQFTTPHGIAGERDGDGPFVAGLHGLTATRRYVLMGARTVERSGRTVLLYDARGHGASAAAPDGDYSYAALARDLGAVLDDHGASDALLIGASMGAHTAVRFALEQPARVRALVIVTPAYDPDAFPAGLERWDALASGLRAGGIEGFISAYPLARLAPQWRALAERVLRQRLAQHADLRALADALASTPRSRPFERWQELAAIAVPTAVVGSRDDADPDHPLAVARAYAESIPAARLHVEEAGASPIAWQGGRLSRLALELDGLGGA